MNIFLVGVVTAVMVYTTDSLWPPTGFHAGWNHAQLHLFGFPMYGVGDEALLRSVPAEDSVLAGGSHGPEGGRLTTLILRVLVIAMLRRIR